MKATFIEREGNTSKFKMEFTAEEFEAAIVKVYQNTKDRYTVDGFRRGKAPRKLIEGKYGAGVFYEDAIGSLFQEEYPQALSTLEVNPVDQPKLDLNEVAAGKDLEITVTVTVMPEIEVKDYKGVKVKKLDATISDEDVEKDLAGLQKRNGRLVESEGPAKNGDTLILDYAGFVDGRQFSGGTASNQQLELGSNQFIPGFEDQLVGVMPGEAREVKVTFPEEYHAEDLAGKDAVFNCTVHEIKTLELAELNDEFAKDVSEFDTLEELKKDIREKLEKTAAEKADYEEKNSVLIEIYQANDVDIPDVMVDDEISQMIAELTQQLKYEGLELQTYLDYIQKDIDGLKEDMRPEAYQKVKTRLLISAIAKQEGIDATDEEMDEELTRMAQMYHKDKDEFTKSMGVEGALMLRGDVINQKALNFVFENAIYE